MTAIGRLLPLAEIKITELRAAASERKAGIAPEAKN